jgi:uncharacterized protein (TIGR02145 family)
MNKTKKYIGLFLLSILPIFTGSQTLIINEVSNGNTGTQEYIEFLVVGENVIYNCGSSSPPCVDIRGWIIDDNSGYHGAGGVAPGCNRFSYNSLWQCVPLGTIITVYNNVEPNTSLPPDDLSMTDNNCRLVIPINNTLLFENNASTPGAVACSYPTTGWISGGNWARIAMANAGDCARLVNLAGCEVSSLCYGDVNQNTQIYFASGLSGTDNVWYFNDNDPTLQINWSEGCADASACGSNNQTGGFANNTLNSAYIAKFNNNCQPIQPIVSNLIGTTPQGCSCDGSASISASGSIGPYTYAWYDQSNNSIGQNSTTASNLCSGNYYCVVTSSIGCSDSISIFIENNCSNSGSFESNIIVSDSNICAGQSITLTVNFGPTYPPGTVNCNGTSTEVVDVTNPVTGKTWMDRNLGASRAATSSTDDQAYGDLYQWGRGADGHQCRNSATTSTLSSTDQPGHGNFILSPNSPNDWITPQNNNLWQGVSGINNPCPNGYRLPTSAELNSERSTWSVINANGAIGSNLKLPLAGFHAYNTGSVDLSSQYGLYWSSTVSGIQVTYLRIRSADAIMIGSIRANGFSVRCMKE